jgi:hypothetical protein
MGRPLLKSWGMFIVGQAIPFAPHRVRRKILLVLGGVLWCALFAAGFAQMLRYEFTPGAASEAPGEWPAASHLRPVSGQATLVMFAHPKCPCTRASMEELAGLMAESAGRVTAQVIFFRPEKAGDDWTQTALWQTAAAIPGVRRPAVLGGKLPATSCSTARMDGWLFTGASPRRAATPGPMPANRRCSRCSPASQRRKPARRSSAVR